MGPRNKADQISGELENKGNPFVRLFEAIPAGIYETTVKGEIVACNSSLAKILGGKDKSDILGRNAGEFYPHPEERQKFVDYLYRHGSHINTVAKLKKLDGSDCWAMINAVLEDNCILGSMIDITEQKKVEEALRRSEESYRGLFDSISEAIYIQDEGGRFIDVNQGALDMYGHERSDFIGKTPEFLSAPGLNNLEETIENARLAFAGQRRQFEWWGRRKNGQVFPKDVILNSGMYFGRQVVIAIARDISIKKRLEEERQNAQKLESLGLLAGGIAHDFNNILTVVMGKNSLAMEHSDARGRGLLQETEKAVLRARELTGKLLTFAQGGAPIKENTSIADLIRESTAFALSGSATAADFSLAEDLKAAAIDRNQINQVLHNLVINASQAMPRGGLVRISAENRRVKKSDDLPVQDGDYVQIKISDQGVGIEEKNRQRIFDPYFTTKPDGTGLGLPTVYSIIKKHGGHISFESQPGAGTTFILLLPTAAEAIPEPLYPEISPTGPATKRILVMDDEEMVREVISGILEARGYQVECLENGESTLRRYREEFNGPHPFSAVIMDLTLPGGMGGKDTLQLLRAVDPAVRAIVISGYSNDPVMADHKRFGFTAALPKPFRDQELLNTLEKVLKN